jgi:SAM-dependent methyltransferase
VSEGAGEPRTTGPVEGPLWTSTADIWAEYWSDFSDPARLVIADATGVGPATRVLDMGCGSGEFCRIAADRGASVSGIDAAEGMLELARARVPEADLRVGAIEQLPWDDDSFDVVTGFNSFQFAAERIDGFREAARVAVPGGRVAVCVWGPAADNQLQRMFVALRELAADEEDDEDAPRLGDPGQLGLLAEQAGLEPLEAGEVEVPFEARDFETLERALTIDVVQLDLLARVGETSVREAIAAAAAAFRRGDGSYRFENRFRYLIASA